MTTEAPEWAGPAPFLTPPEPVRRDHGVLGYVGVTYAVAVGPRPLQLDLWVPDAAAPPPLVVHVHGGGFLPDDRRYPPETVRGAGHTWLGYDDVDGLVDRSVRHLAEALA